MNDQIKKIAETVALESDNYCLEKFDLSAESNQFFVSVFVEYLIEYIRSRIFDLHATCSVEQVEFLLQIDKKIQEILKEQ